MRIMTSYDMDSIVENMPMPAESADSSGRVGEDVEVGNGQTGGQIENWGDTRAEYSMESFLSHVERHLERPAANNHVMATRAARAAQSTRNEAVIVTAFSNATGREAVCAAMVEPIQTSLMYQSMARKIFMSTNIYPAIHPYRKNEVWWNGKRTLLRPVVLTFNQEISRPIESQYRESLDGLQKDVFEALEIWENRQMRGLFDCALRAHPENLIKCTQDKVQLSIRKNIGEISARRDVATKLFMTPRTYFPLFWRGGPISDFDEATNRDMLMTGLYGHYGSMDLHVWHEGAEQRLYMTGFSQKVGDIYHSAPVFSNLRIEDGIMRIQVFSEIQLHMHDLNRVYAVQIV